MRCKACNKIMEPTEIKWNKMLDDWEVCGSCLHIVKESLDSFSDKEEDFNGQSSNTSTSTVS